MRSQLSVGGEVLRNPCLYAQTVKGSLAPQSEYEAFECDLPLSPPVIYRNFHKALLKASKYKSFKAN